MSTFANPSPAINNNTNPNNDPYEGGQGNKIPLQYISAAVLFGSVSILALLVVIYGFRRAPSSANLDPERAQYPIIYLGTFQDPSQTRAFLDTVSPSTAFKNLEDEFSSKTNQNANKKETTTPPDQSGTIVTCVICLDDFNPKSAVRRLPCGHIFHAVCIEEWLLMKRHVNCPLCNKCYLPEMPDIARPVFAHTARAYSL